MKTLKKFILDDLGFLGFDLTIRKRVAYLKGIKHKSVLDVGCGDNGYIPYLLCRQGNNVLGIDKRAEAIGSARKAHLGKKELDFRQMDISNLGILKEKFDCAVCMEVIEHIIDDRKLLRNMHAAIRKGGLLVVSTININSQIAKEPADTVLETEDGGHVRRGYTKKELEEKIREAGFKVLQSSSCVGRITRQAILLEQRVRKHSRIRYNLLLRALLFAFLYPITLLDNSHDNPEDMTLIITARRC